MESCDGTLYCAVISDTRLSIISGPHAKTEVIGSISFFFPPLLTLPPLPTELLQASNNFSSTSVLNPLCPTEPSLVATWSETCGRDSSSSKYRRCSLPRAPTITSIVQPCSTDSLATKYMGAAP